MCGVNVIVDRTLELDHTSIERMNQAISSRGPDGTGVHVLYLQDKQVFFGNTRLGIRGEGEDMHQPLISRSGVISYNGEIYSSTQNASIPQNNTHFLLDFLSQEDVSELGKLNKMFAFAFYPISADEL